MYNVLRRTLIIIITAIDLYTVTYIYKFKVKRIKFSGNVSEYTAIFDAAGW